MRPRSPEPKGKLDAMTGYSFSTPVWDGRTWVRPAVGEVAVTRIANGPEDRPREQDAPAGWDKIDWRAQGGQGRRARPRGLKGSPGAGWARGRELHELILRGPAKPPGHGGAVTGRQSVGPTPRVARGGSLR